MRGLLLSPANHRLAALPATMSAFNNSADTGFLQRKENTVIASVFNLSF